MTMILILRIILAIVMILRIVLPIVIGFHHIVLRFGLPIGVHPTWRRGIEFAITVDVVAWCFSSLPRSM
ncbi:hypothetical protein BJX68DRAFT_239382 [Aspergillus pseudodeflectus]|uniref:Secreted peptide n=1 Tax=Aspergillus pseudodeflectus TaxID=176178 RepID=A0ABR4K5K1_9EURO